MAWSIDDTGYVTPQIGERNKILDITHGVCGINRYPKWERRMLNQVIGKELSLPRKCRGKIFFISPQHKQDYVGNHRIVQVEFSGNREDG